MKGIETVRRDWCEIVSDTTFDVLNIILKENDIFVLDIGSNVEGYHADHARTYFIGTPDSKFRKIYNIVLGALKNAFQMIKEDRTIDEIFRETKAQMGDYQDFFQGFNGYRQGLGHGVGLHLDELPYIIAGNKNDAVKAVIALSYYSTSHTRFRHILNRICGTRYASMPLFDEKMLSGPMTVNWKKMNERTKKIARIINRYERIEIACPNGTSISFSIKGRKALPDTGIMTKPGQFSNLPAGEVYLAPLEGTAKGKLVLDWAPTQKLKKPVIAYVAKGVVQKLEGNEQYVQVLQDKLNEKKWNRNIAELGIGTNNKAIRPDNILESEKIMGTIHIAFGDNSSFGGKVSTSFHQDHVFFKPTVKLISKSSNERVLLKRGRLLLK